MNRLKKTGIAFLILLLLFTGYFLYANRNSRNMTFRQKMLKAVYPAYMWWTKMRGKNVLTLTNKELQPPVSFYSLKATLTNGEAFDFDSLRNKKVMLVNTASDCGYTPQYDALQRLYDENQGSLVILAFPADDFKKQESGTDESIARFCKMNYGIRFPLMKKSQVKKGDQQNPVFQWLTDSLQNGWNTKAPSWNFSKYLINEKGMLTHYFGSSIPPLGDEIKSALGGN